MKCKLGRGCLFDLCFSNFVNFYVFNCVKFLNKNVIFKKQKINGIFFFSFFNDLVMNRLRLMILYVYLVSFSLFVVSKWINFL